MRHHKWFHSESHPDFKVSVTADQATWMPRLKRFNIELYEKIMKMYWWKPLYRLDKCNIWNKNYDLA